MLAVPACTASLDAFFHPHGVAVIGASRDPAKLSHAVLQNLLDREAGYPGPVYLVNPNAPEILGARCYPDIAAVPDPVELAVLVIPAHAVPAAIEACGRRGIQAAVIISGGFREVGAAGAALEREVVAIARRHKMRLMGPNGIGVIDTYTPLNTTFVRGRPARGPIAFLSQSGALCGGIIDWVIGRGERGIGFSRLLSVGNEADVNETDLLLALAEDEHTQVITLYLEDVKDGPGFIAALRETAARKPVLALKAGRTSSGQAATRSHTGALAGAHAAFRAVCRQTGVIECDTVASLFGGAQALAFLPPLAGRRVAILTNAGGPAALAADTMETLGLTLARTSPATQSALRACVVPDAQLAGPVDLLGGATVEEYGQALATLLDDAENDGILAILVPQALVDAAAVVETLAGVAERRQTSKPLLLCLMGEASLGAATAAAHQHRIPAYTFPEDAVAALGILSQRGRWLARSHEQPAVPALLPGMRLDLAQSLIEAESAAGRQTLDAVEGRAVVQALGIAVPQDQLAATADEAAEAARQVGFPVALKIVSPAISHKTDVGGVLLALQDEEAVRAGFQSLMERARAANLQATIRGVQVQQMVRGGVEVIVGTTRDPTFGPLVLFGMGGIYAEALADVSVRLAPLARADAEEMLAEVRAAKILTGLRGAAPPDREALIATLLRVGWLAHACPHVRELDLNPLLVLPEGQGISAVDARFVLH
jgi:acetyltransferase